MGPEAFVVLAVGFFLGVAGIEAGDAVEVVAAVFAQGIGVGEAEVAPGGVVAGDVFAGGFDALGDDFDVIVKGVYRCGLCMAGLGSLRLCRLGPFFGIECLFHAVKNFLRNKKLCESLIAVRYRSLSQ